MPYIAILIRVNCDLDEYKVSGKKQSKVGWREWVRLPELGIPAIKAKVDTGARTSALHTFDLQVIDKPDGPYARFMVHPLQKRMDIVLTCEARIIDERPVRDSGGHTEQRFVIETRIDLGNTHLPAEITLTKRDDMAFRMLLGRTALVNAGVSVDPKKSYLAGRKPDNLLELMEEFTS